MEADWVKYLVVAVLVLFAFVPVTINALKRRHLKPPPLAAKDRKLYRLWRSDPDAYQRQYGAMDQQLLDQRKEKENKKGEF